MTRSWPLVMLWACAQAPSPPDCTGTSAPAVASVLAVDSGQGIESVDTTLGSCGSEPLAVYQTCCGTRERRVEVREDGVWTPYEVGDVCACAGLTPETLGAGEAIEFPTRIDGPDLCTIGGGDFRAVYAVGPEGCAAESCWEEITSNEYYVYCEG